LSILIAVAVGDVALVMGENIVPLRNNLAVAVSGPQHGAELAVAELRGFAPTLAPNVHSQLKRVAFGASSQVAAKVGLLAAGFDGLGGFVAGASYSPGISVKPESVVLRALDNVAYTVVGGEEAGAAAKFSERLTSVFAGGKKPEGDRDALVASILDAGFDTIGGRTPHHVLHRA
jgi:hypothetical protein